MYSRAGEFRIDFVATGADGHRRSRNPTALAENASAGTASLLAGADHWRQGPSMATLRTHLDDLADHACRETGAVAVELTLHERTVGGPDRATASRRAVHAMSTGREELRMLGVARACFGGLVLLRTTPVLAPLHIPYLEGTMPLLGWPAATWHVAAFGLALPAGVVATLCILRTVATILFTLGVRAGPAGVAGGVLGWVVLAQDAMSYVNTLHLLFLGMVVLAVERRGERVRAAAGAHRRSALRPRADAGPGRVRIRMERTGEDQRVVAQRRRPGSTSASIRWSTACSPSPC